MAGTKTRSSPAILAALLFLAGAIVMLLFCVLAGVRDSTPLNQTWFLQADTSGIPNASPLSHFTMYQVCDGINGRNQNCRSRKSAFPMLPQRYFGTETNVPAPFLQSPNKFFYLSRFAYAFYIISIAFCVFAFLAALAALCSTIATGVAAALAAFALFCVTFTACVMTACYVMARNAFRDVGRFARVGVKAFAFTWTSLALITLALASLLAALAYRSRRSRQARRATTIKKVGVKGSNKGGVIGGLIERLRSRWVAAADRDSYDGTVKRSYDSGYTSSERGQQKQQLPPSLHGGRSGGHGELGGLELGRRENLVEHHPWTYGERGNDTLDIHGLGSRPATSAGITGHYDDQAPSRSEHRGARFAGATSEGGYTVPGVRTTIGRGGVHVADNSAGAEGPVYLNLGRP